MATEPTIKKRLIWTGAYDGDLHDARNYEGGVAPKFDGSEEVIIPLLGLNVWRCDD